MTLSGSDALGVFGVLLVLSAYAALMARRLRGDGVLFPLFNLLGAAAIAVSLLHEPSLDTPVLIMQIAWMAISGYGVYRCIADRTKPGE